MTMPAPKMNNERERERLVRDASFSDRNLRVRQFIVVDATEDDYLICNGYDGANATTVQFTVARPPMLRASMDSRDDLTFVYSDSQTRVATDLAAATENQEIVPMYLPDDVIFAIAGIIGGTGVVDSSGRAVEWQQIADNRVWAKS